MNNNETNPLREEVLAQAIREIIEKFAYGVGGPSPAIKAGDAPAAILKLISDRHQSLPAEQPEKTEGQHVCCGMIKNPDTGQYQKEPHDLCGWSCQPVWESSQPEGKTLEEEIKDKAETYAFSGVDSNHVAELNLIQGYIAGATEYANHPRKEWVSVADRLPEPHKRVRAIRTYGNGRMEETHTSYIEKTECFDDLHTDIITHWQYIDLPTPPQK